MNRPLLIGLTGGIASGKSLVANHLKQKGFKVIFSDKIAHDVLEDSQIINKLIDLFGDEIISNGHIDRQALGRIVFADMKLREALNQLVHPRVRERVQSIIDNCTDPILFIEIPLLIENGLNLCFDAVVNIFTTTELQKKRLMERTGISNEEAEQRIKSQMSVEEKKSKADINIENSGSVELLFKSIDQFISKLDKMKPKKILRFTDRL